MKRFIIAASGTTRTGRIAILLAAYEPFVGTGAIRSGARHGPCTVHSCVCACKAILSAVVLELFHPYGELRGSHANKRKSNEESGGAHVLAE